MRTLKHQSLQQQSGIVLVIGLIMLVLLSVIGASGMQGSGLEEKMAGNDRDQASAFQAAETALRAGELQAKALYDDGDIELFCDGTLGSGTAGDNQNGLFVNPRASQEDGFNCEPCTAGAECTLPNPLSSISWTSDDSSIAVPDTSLLEGSNGRYYISYDYYYRSKNDDKTMDDYYFTVTARGIGSQGGEVVLRSYFGAKIDMGKI